jgi:hypothetical protein
MSEKKETDAKKTLSLKGGTLSLKGGASKARASSPAQGTVVEVRRRRAAKDTPPPAPVGGGGSTTDRHLTDEEREARARALKSALSGPKKKAEYDDEIGKKVERAPAKSKTPANADDARAAELAELERIEAEERAKADEANKTNQANFQRSGFAKRDEGSADEASYRDRLKKAPAPRT